MSFSNLNRATFYGYELGAEAVFNQYVSVGAVFNYMKLTKRAIEGLQANGTRYEVRDDDLKGFVVRVGISGERSFYFVYRAGKGRAAPLKRLRLGTFPTMTVEQGREIAKQKAAQVALGEDPAEQVKEGKTAPNVHEALEFFLEQHGAKLKPNTLRTYRQIANAHDDERRVWQP